MKFLIASGFVFCALSLAAVSKEETPKVPRGTYHVNDLEAAKAEAVKEGLPICYMVG